MTFTDWLAAKVGTCRWCAAPRLTARLRAEGYDLAISQARFDLLEVEYERETGDEARRILADYRRRFGFSLLTWSHLDAG